MRTLGDLTCNDYKKARWYKPALVSSEWLSAHLPPNPPDQPTVLRCGQLWKVFNSSGGHCQVAEILGGSAGLLMVRVWKSVSKINLARGGILSLKASTTLGAGSDVELSVADVFGGFKKTIRVFASPPKLSNSVCQRTIVHAVRQHSPVWPTTGQALCWVEQVAQLLKLACDGGYDVFTDGSWKTTGDNINKLFGHNLTEVAGGGFCVMRAGALPGEGTIIAVHIVKKKPSLNLEWKPKTH